MDRRLQFGLRARLLLLVLLAVLPAFGLTLWVSEEERQSVRRTARQDVLQLVRLAVSAQRDVILHTRLLLRSLATTLTPRGGGAGCHQRLRGLLQLYPHYTNIGVVGADGRVTCAARPLAAAVDLSTRAFFRRAIAFRDFSIGEIRLSDLAERAALIFGQPIVNASTSVEGVVFVVQDVGWLGELKRETGLPDDTVVTLIDEDGTVLYRQPDHDVWVGKALPELPLFKTAVGDRREGTAEHRGVDGMRRLYAYAPLIGQDHDVVFVWAGMPVASIYAPAQAHLVRNLSLLAAVAVVVIAIAWFAGTFLLVRRCRQLAQAADTIGAGDLAARTGLPYGADELGRLAKAVDNMAHNLESRQRHLDRVLRARAFLGETNHALLRATTETELLQRVCRIAVEFGGYSMAWVGLPADNDRRALQPVAQAGVEAEHLRPGEINWVADAIWHPPEKKDAYQQAPLVITDIHSDPRHSALSRVASKRGYRSCAILPLVRSDRLIGVLTLCTAEAIAFDAEELALLKEVADDLAYGVSALRTQIEHTRSQEAIARMAYADAVTGLPNRIAFREKVQSMLRTSAQAGDGKLGVLLINIVRFRDVNDTLGHVHGDCLLRQVGDRLSRTLYERDMIARIGADEFGVVLSGADSAENVEYAAQKLREGLEPLFVVERVPIRVDVNIGAAIAPDHGTDVDALLRHADVALLFAKQRGDFAFYESSRDPHSPRRLALVAELREAIDRNQLVLHYQPKIDLRSDSVVGAEVLLRWQHPLYGLVFPNEFIEPAESTGLIWPVTQWVVGSALRECAACRDTGMELVPSINLSARLLNDLALPGQIAEQLGRTGIPPSMMQFEITESALMTDPARALEVLTRLHEMGIRLHIDDFGMGHSSLTYLQRLPIDAIKIDRSFVLAMTSDENAATIVRSIIELGHNLRCTVIAEGVETEQALVWLKGLGCDEAQGYFIARPMPAAELLDWLRSRPT